MTDERTERFSHAAGIAPLFVGVLAGPLAWLASLQASWMLVAPACERASRIALHLASLGAVLAAATGAVVAWRAWTEAGRVWPDEAGGPIPRSRFLAAIGVLVSALFALVIVAQGIAGFVLDPCL